VTGTWWHLPLTRYQPPPGLRPGGDRCWVPGCGKPGWEYKPGWLQCDHPEGPVQWYGGTVPLVLSNGAGVRP
jgi:hypothetical protein